MGLKVALNINKNDFGLEWGSPRLGETVTIIGHLLYLAKIEDE
jgi:hypothetical protein